MKRQYKDYSDEQLIVLYASGCNEAFDALLLRYDAYIHSYIRYNVSDEDLVEDIFQDAFIKVMTTIRQGRYSESGRFKQWLTRLTHNLVMDRFRQQRTRGNSCPIEMEGEGRSVLWQIGDDSPSSLEQMVLADEIGDLHRQINSLPREQREVVELRFWEELSFKEIAEKTGVSINTALGRMRYALINLRKHIPSS